MYGAISLAYGNTPLSLVSGFCAEFIEENKKPRVFCLHVYCAIFASQ